MTFLIAVPDRGEVLQLDRHDVGRLGLVRHPDAVVDRLPDHLPLRRSDRHHPGLAGAGLPAVRLVLRGRALPLRRVRHGGVRDVRRVLLLVAEDDRPDARRAARQAALLAAVHRLPHHVPGAALAGCRGHAAALRVVRRERGLHHAEPGVQRRCLHPRPVDAAVLLQRLQVAQVAAGRRGRPVGLGPLAGVGDQFAAAAAQLRAAAADPVREPGVRPAPPGHRAGRVPGQPGRRDNLLDAGEDQGRVENLERLNAGTDAEGKDKA